jgi:hypothetical protein
MRRGGEKVWVYSHDSAVAEAESSENHESTLFVNAPPTRSSSCAIRTFKLSFKEERYAPEREGGNEQTNEDFFVPQLKLVILGQEIGMEDFFGIRKKREEKVET